MTDKIQKLIDHIINSAETIRNKYDLTSMTMHFNRAEIFCSWFIPNMKLINKIKEIHEQTGLPVYDMGCGYGLMVAILNYVGVTTYGFDNYSEGNSNSNKILKRFLDQFDIPMPDQKYFIEKDIETISNSDFIFFESWGRSPVTLENYIKNGGKYTFIIGEGPNGCTSPNCNYVINNYSNLVKLNEYIFIPKWPGLSDIACFTELNNYEEIQQ